MSASEKARVRARAFFVPEKGGRLPRGLMRSTKK
jgi:hypothetical protein